MLEAPSEAANVNPMQGLALPEIYKALMEGRDGMPRWPDEKLQKGYTGTCGVDLLRRAFQFVEMLEKDGAFVPDWKGLDYGCGWGRIASVLLSKGSPSQLDLCDAWPKTLNVISGLGYRNRVFAVSELLEENELPPETYDFILSFSVFTHLSPAAFEQNIPVLVQALKPGGRFYFTVRHDEFIDHKYSATGPDCREELARSGVLFLDSGGNLGAKAVFGDTVVAPAYLESLLRDGQVLRYLGQPHSLQHVYAIEKLMSPGTGGAPSNSSRLLC